MPRRREVPKREVLPDPVYQSQLVTKFINCVMERGKKSTARGSSTGDEADRVEDLGRPLKTFKKALENVKPSWRSSPGASGVDVPGSGRGQAEPAGLARHPLDHLVLAGAGEKTMKDKLAGRSSTPPTTGETP